jgi:hypothetical protein
VAAVLLLLLDYLAHKIQVVVVVGQVAVAIQEE